MVGFFDTVRKIFNFSVLLPDAGINCYAHYTVMVKKVPVSKHIIDACWLRHADAVKALRKEYKDICKAFGEIANDEHEKHDVRQEVLFFLLFRVHHLIFSHGICLFTKVQVL